MPNRRARALEVPRLSLAKNILQLWARNKPKESLEIHWVMVLVRNSSLKMSPYGNNRSREVDAP